MILAWRLYGQQPLASSSIFQSVLKHHRFVLNVRFRLLVLQIVTNCYTGEKHSAAKVVNIYSSGKRIYFYGSSPN